MTDVNIENFTLKTDSYKIPQWNMYAPETENSFAYFESRKGAKYPFTKWTGLQYILKRHFAGEVVTRDDIEEGEEFANAHFGHPGYFNRPMWERIVNKHGGHLPIRIRAIPEGTVVPIDMPLMNIEVTDDCTNLMRGLTGHCETILTHVWFPSNVATIGHDLKEFFRPLFDKASDEPTMLDYLLHDFGFRGCSTFESSGVGGLAHLTNFYGTDTISGIQFGRKYYNTRNMLGYSVAASEHSIKTSLGEEGEHIITNHLLDTFKDGILSDVQDSFSIESAIHYIGQNLKTKIENRKGKYVFRPDSPRFKGDTPHQQIKWIADTLCQYFGFGVNSKGYKVLNPKVGIIYGDGLSAEEIKTAIAYLVDSGYAPETSLYGMGGGLLQKHNRDTQRSAFKSSSQKRKGIWYDVFKNPTDATKASKRGRVETFRKPDGTFFWGLQGEHEPYMETIFENGELIREYSFDEIRKNGGWN